MNILFVDSWFPMFDRASVDVRMMGILRLLRDAGHSCVYYVFESKSQEEQIGVAEVARYKHALEQMGLRVVVNVGIDDVLEQDTFDAVYFKYYYSAASYAEAVRLWQPKARVIVDSVDLVYRRLTLKAAVTGDVNDLAAAQSTKLNELKAYAAADTVITVTDEEAQLLQSENPQISTYVIPNIHESVSTLRCESGGTPTLIFIGVFSHEPNVDAVEYFAKEIWPIVLRSVPTARWLIVGGKPPSMVRDLASKQVQVLGYVPDTLPFLRESWVSVAPLRFGAGMKGKIGEAMAAGVPVVTTSIGTQGCDFRPEEQLLVGDTPAEFAAQVVRLLTDQTLRARLSSNGRCFVRDNYSPEVVGKALSTLFEPRSRFSAPKAIPMRGLRFAGLRSKRFLDRHLFWRFKSA
jgi:glycosyltransferase involved in cell wall biosynthesis